MSKKKNLGVPRTAEVVRAAEKAADAIKPSLFSDLTTHQIAQRRQGYMKAWVEEVEPLEAENAKLRDLLQELVNDMRRLRIEFGNRTGTTTQVGIASLESAKEQGFVPTNTTEG
jgi:hypothetical protein